MDLNSLELANPWWQDEKTIRGDEHIATIQGEPYYFDHPIKNRLPLEPGLIFIVRGPRQVGKTTLLKEKILEAITTKKINAKHCIFFSCEAIAHFEKLQELLAEVLKDRRQSFTLLCLDEITFVREWQRAILWLSNAGLCKEVVILITGSDAHDLKISSERFPGREVKEVALYPYSFFDYPQIPFFKNFSREELFEIYLQVGGFPRAIADFCRFGVVQDKTYETYTNWILGDAHRYQLGRETLTHILCRIAETLGSQVTWNRLIEQTPVKSFETAMAYVEHLELAFLCHVISCYDPNKDRAAPRKAKKIYFVDPLIYALAGGFLRGVRKTFDWWKAKLVDLEFKGKVFESMALAHFLGKQEPIYYWYSKGLGREVDVLIRRPDRLDLKEIKLKKTFVKPALNQNIQVITPEDFIFGDV